MTTAWSHLPNAVHIDRVIASVRSHLAEWAAATAGPRAPVWVEAYITAAATVTAASRVASRNAAWAAAGNVAGWAAIAALIAWDDSAKYLDMPSDRLKVWVALSEDPACILLLSTVIAFEKINELQIS